MKKELGARIQEPGGCARIGRRHRPRPPRQWRGSMRCAITQRLEGSRFGVYLAALAHFVAMLVRPGRVQTGGSRE